ncbi:unnamed protein product [Aphis gossypii]|uniref:Uncharacterized protein n=1 Tax=Aphis gossypii TaxID=80765 RepID=A0A9P0NNA4_APHGO|nr:unnamed protein product [Aphis gossypii]
MHYPMIQLLAYQLNFNYTLTITDDHGWSYGNGSFFGLTGILQREESDFGAAGSLMRLDRMTAVDFTVGTVSLESNILFKQPMLSSVTNIHIEPFKYEVWQVTLVMLMGFVLILLFLNKFKANRRTSLNVLEIIGLVHGAICQQGSTIVLVLNSIKIVVFVLFSTTFFLFNAYSASIVSLLQSTSSSINNVKDLLHEKSMTMSIQIATYAKPYFNETTNEILRKLYDVKIKPYDENNSFTDASRGIERIRTEFHGFMVEKTSAYQIINRKWREEEKCGLYEIQLFKLPVLAIPVVKKSGYKDVFKQKLIQQHEVGIKKRLIQRWTPKKPTCDSAKKNRNYVSVSIKEILPTIILFGYGLLISLTVLVLELAYYYVANSADYNEMLNVLKIFFVRRHVQTVTAAITCWPFDVNKKLLDDLSTADISVSFNSHTLQYYSTWYRCAFIIDLSCENSTEILQQISNDRLFNTQNDWILFDQNSFANETNSAQFALRTFQLYLGNAYVLPDASVFLFLKTYDGVWEIWSGFRASKSDAIRVFEIGTASLNRMTIREMHDEKRNFRGVTLKSTSVIVEKDSFFGFDKKISSDLDVFAHMHYEMIVTLTNQLNFKTEITIVNDYGWYLGNGSFGGLIGLLQNEAIDFSATGVLIRTDRMSVIDFAVGIVELRTAAMFRQPSLSSVHNILLLPFTTDVWIGICATFCVFVFTLMFLMRVNNYLGEKKYGSLNVPEIVTLVHGAICQQGFNSTLTLISIRVVIAVLFFTSVFFYTSYSASIAALVQSNSNSIKSIKDIVESSMTFSTQISPYGKRYFEVSIDYNIILL